MSGAPWTDMHGVLLDVEVEEKIFGRRWVLTDSIVVNKCRYRVPTWIPEGTDINNPPAGTMVGQRPPRYSEEIDTAWRIIDKLADRYHVRVTGPFRLGDPYFAGFTPLGCSGFNGRPDYQASGKTAALAICWAGLEAV